jgi:methylmalonyl-CoA epimerase
MSEGVGREEGPASGPVGPIDHVAIVVRSIEQALPRYRQLFGLEPGPIQQVDAQRVRLCFLPSGGPGAARIELIEPTDGESGVARFLDARGEGLHHVCLRTVAIGDALGHVSACGAELIDAEPRRGAEGMVAFIHPRTLNGVLWELLQPDD